MEKPKTDDYDFNYLCRGCDTCTSEKERYNRDLEIWEDHQAEQAKRADSFWMVAGGPNSPRARHQSYELAHNEAKRLAEKQPGTPFYVVRPVTKTLAEPPKAVSTALNLWTTT